MLAVQRVAKLLLIFRVWFLAEFILNFEFSFFYFVARLKVEEMNLNSIHIFMSEKHKNLIGEKLTSILQHPAYSKNPPLPDYYTPAKNRDSFGCILQKGRSGSFVTEAGLPPTTRCGL